jgi:hypothetical protein
MDKAEEKDQVATEYIITYGWAIIIIVTILLALYEFGVFNSIVQGPRLPPGSCFVYKSSAGSTLQGLCNGQPEYIGAFSGTTQPGIPRGPSAYVAVNDIYLNTSGGGTNTAMFWLYWNGTVNATPIGFPGYYMWASPSGCFGFVTGNKNDYGISSSSISGKWVFVTAVFYNGQAVGNDKLYIDGVQQTMSQCYGTTHSGSVANPILIGSTAGTRIAWYGDIADVQIYNNTLSQAEIQGTYKEGMGGAPVTLRNLIGWWPLNGNTNDYSGNEQNGQSVGALNYLGGYSYP